MTTLMLQREQWKSYFDRVSHHLPATEIVLRLVSSDLGDQVVFEDAELVGLDYDDQTDAFEVVTPASLHRIPSPRSVSVEESGEGLHAVAVTDDQGRQHILTLRRALELPSDGTAASTDRSGEDPVR